MGIAVFACSPPHDDNSDVMSWKPDPNLSDEENFQRLAEFIKQLPRPEKAPYPDPMLPPWQGCPDVPMFSIGWRMGGCETYMTDFRAWFDAMPIAMQQDYIANHPEPDEWQHWWILVMEGSAAFKEMEESEARR